MCIEDWQSYYHYYHYFSLRLQHEETKEFWEKWSGTKCCKSYCRWKKWVEVCGQVEGWGQPVLTKCDIRFTPSITFLSLVSLTLSMKNILSPCSTKSPKTRVKSEETKLKDRKRSQRHYHANKEGILQARRLKYVRCNKDRLIAFRQAVWRLLDQNKPEEAMDLMRTRCKTCYNAPINE